MNLKTAKMKTLRMMMNTAKKIPSLNEKQKDILHRFVNGYSPLDIAILMNERAKDIRQAITLISARLGVDRGGLRSNIYAMGFANVATSDWPTYSVQVYSEISEELEARIKKQSEMR